MLLRIDVYELIFFPALLLLPTKLVVVVIIRANAGRPE
jgi:hypothetical protein